MAIAYDNVLADAAGTASSVTRAHTVTGSNTALVVGIMHGTGQTVSSVTYNGTNMTAISTANPAESAYQDLWYLVGTATGSNNIVVTFSASTDYRCSAASYTGVGSGGGTGGSDSSNKISWTAVSGDQTLTTTTVADNAWVAFYGRTQSGYTAGTNVTYRNNVANVVFIGDGGPKTPAGSFSQVFTNTTGSNTGGISGVGMKPYAAASGPTNLKSLDTNLKANIKSYNTNLIANVKSINTNT